jgi:hypothetical protein
MQALDLRYHKLVPVVPSDPEVLRRWLCRPECSALLARLESDKLEALQRLKQSVLSHGSEPGSNSTSGTTPSLWVGFIMGLDAVIDTIEHVRLDPKKEKTDE